VKTRWFRLAHLAGTALVLAALIFIARRIWTAREALGECWRPGILPALFGAACLGFAGTVALAFSWWVLLRYYGGSQLNFREAFKLYGGTQIAKYIPGNVFQYAGRQVVGWRMGVSQGTMALSSIGEALGLCCVAAMLALAGLAWSREASFFAGCLGGAACVAAFPLSQVLLKSLSQWFPKLVPESPKTRWRDKWRVLGPAFAGQVVFFATGALAFALCASPWGSVHFWKLVMVSAAAWLAGFVTPGAPGGLGVREAILVMALEGTLGKGGALAAAALFRAATTLGDVALYIATLFFRRLWTNINASQSG
jgi:hypothetical protein